MTNILVVDDSAIDRKLVEGLLRSEQDWVVEQAENGNEALRRMNANRPDLVVTDLIMPELDGMQLVSRIKEGFPEVPVIIITGKGSEWMAVKALERGAASYVPKSKLNDVLVEAIQQVLQMIESDRSYQRLIDGLQETAYQFCIESDPALIAPLVNLFKQMAYAMKICSSTERHRLGVALDEALLNAMYHGNLELPRIHLQETRTQLRAGKPVSLIQQRLSEPPFKDRMIHVKAKLTREHAIFVVRDEGIGFKCQSIPDAGDAKTLKDGGGRGLVLIKNFMDDVKFNDTGNEIRMKLEAKDS